MDKEGLPSYNDLVAGYASKEYSLCHQRRKATKLLLIVLFTLVIWITLGGPHSPHNRAIIPLYTVKLQQDHALCSRLRSKPQDPSGHRDRSARFVDGHKSVLIKNATIWTGVPAEGASADDIRSGKAFSWLSGDVLLHNGLIQHVGASSLDPALLRNYTVYNAGGRPLTAGIVDMHSHAGVNALPSLDGNDDTNELSENITPFVRSIDGLDPLDPQIQVIKSGGVTTSLILPGSGNNMGGEAYVIKHAVGPAGGREEISAHDLLADPDHNWRYMKMACGENAKRVTQEKFGRDKGPFSRLGEAWYFRHAFEQAAKLVQRQDEWCEAADAIGADNMQGHLPLDLKWESLAAVLRGQVRVNTHCYTVPDLESFVGFTNEFNFSVRAFHHAHQAYLVPEILKRAYGEHPPAAALFADNMYYKVESYTASEQAGKILYDAGLTPVYVSDNPVINSQHVLFEAAKAFRYGLPYHAALAGVTSASAELLGLGERIGKVKAGFDADIVVWDSDPLSVGATPMQVFIDGVPQFENPVVLTKPLDARPLSRSGRQTTLDEPADYDQLIVTGISEVWLRQHSRSLPTGSQGNLLVSQGQITCLGDCTSQIAAARQTKAHTLELSNAFVIPGLTAFGSSLGMVEIEGEDETSDGSNTAESFSAAVDGLLLDGKNLAAAYAHGVTKAISAPLFRGVSAGFRTGAKHSLEGGAVWADHVALHYSLTPEAKQGKTPAMSGVIGELRSKLRKARSTEKSTNGSISEGDLLHRVMHESFPLVLTTHSTDVMASIIRLKAELELESAKSELRIIIKGAAESHLVAEELKASNISIVLAPLLPYATSWDQRRSLTGAPLTNGTTLDSLLGAGIHPSKIAIGVNEDWEARDLDLAAGIAFVNSVGLTEDDAIGLVSTNVLNMLGLSDVVQAKADSDFVIYEGSPFDMSSRVRVVADGRKVVRAWT